jgi:hypothetical protein
MVMTIIVIVVGTFHLDSSQIINGAHARETRRQLSIHDDGSILKDITTERKKMIIKS